ncbi:hypothetical protein KC19_2G075000 [Ceratodon purpureus]|uniref:Uncharacterized protein n=1 Tax=Ceratodon purpureus TaxID=3225 RepID=A0A8T0IV45_CERPU|nr:hypothetical protein KC19_2G075000 [Ceratodon purpureus]
MQFSLHSVGSKRSFIFVGKRYVCSISINCRKASRFHSIQQRLCAFHLGIHSDYCSIRRVCLLLEVLSSLFSPLLTVKSKFSKLLLSHAVLSFKNIPIFEFRKE